MRRILLAALLLALLGAACGGSPDAGTSTTSAPTSTTTTTMATTTTLSQEEQDAAMGAALWEGYTEAWAEGPEAAARYVVDHTYPGMPATYEGCLEPDRPPGYKSYLADPSTLAPDPGWEPSGIDLNIEGRVYTMEVLRRTGVGADAEEETVTLHFAVLNGAAYLFVSCGPAPTTTTTIPADALAYRLEVGDTYGHQVTFSNYITEDQTEAGGTVRTGTESWTHYVSFEVTGTNDSGTPRLAMTFDRVIWEMFSAGVHRNGFDSDVDDEGLWWGYHGDLVGDTTTLTVSSDGPRIDGNTSQSFLTLPAAPVAPGDTWESEWALADPRLSGTMTVTATEVGNEVVRVSFEGTGSGTRTTGEIAEIELEYITEGDITGTAVIDAATGWVRSMTIDIDAEGTIEVTSTGIWFGIRPLAGSAELAVGIPMPVTYVIHIETTTTTE
jgi:hypothetical protein